MSDHNLQQQISLSPPLLLISLSGVYKYELIKIGQVNKLLKIPSNFKQRNLMIVLNNTNIPVINALYGRGTVHRHSR